MAAPRRLVKLRDLSGTASSRAEPVPWLAQTLYSAAMGHCPKCRNTQLLPLQLRTAAVELGAVPSTCPSCGGIWLQRGALTALYQSGALTELGVVSRPRRDTDRRTGLCPEGHGILTRAKGAWEQPYYLERCSKCGGLWLDEGEWQRLIDENLIDAIDELWEPAWRRQLQRRQSARALGEELRAKFGPELVNRLEQLASELAVAPHANLALAYLRESIRAGRRISTFDPPDLTDEG